MDESLLLDVRCVTLQHRRREQLRPYVMEQYQAAATHGTPVMRPLFFDFWLDPAAAAVDDQLMFGSVQPIYMSTYVHRHVYTPEYNCIFTTPELYVCLYARVSVCLPAACLPASRLY